MKNKCTSFAIIVLLITNILLTIFTVNVNAEENLDSFTLSFNPDHVIMHPTDNILYSFNKINRKVYEINLDTKEERFIEFKNKTPENIYLKNNTLYICTSIDTIEDDGIITLVDTDSFTISKEININKFPLDIVVDDNDTMYVSSYSCLASYSISTGIPIDVQSLWYNYKIAMHPSKNRIYGCQITGNPCDLQRYDIENGNIATPIIGERWGDIDPHSTLDITPDGKYIFTDSGKVYYCNDIPKRDMTYSTQLGVRYSDIAFDLSNNRFFKASIDNIIYSYSYDTFEEVSHYKLNDKISFLFYQNNNLISITNDSNNIYKVNVLNENKLVKSDIDYSRQITGTMCEPIFNKNTNEAYILDRSFNKVHVLDCNKNIFEGEYTIPYSPSNGCLSEDGTKLYIVNNDIDFLITELNLENGITRTLKYPSKPDYIFETYKRIYNKNNKLYLLTENGDDSELLIFDSNTFQPINYSTDGVVTSNGNLNSIGTLAFTNDNKYMITLTKTRFSYYYSYKLTKYEIIGSHYKKVSESNSLTLYNTLADRLKAPIIIKDDLNYLLYDTYMFNLDDFTQSIELFSYAVLALNPEMTVSATPQGMYYLKYNVSNSYPFSIDSLHTPNLFFNNDGVLYICDAQTIEVVFPLPGDLNGDTEIDILDLATLSSCYNSKYEDNNYKQIYDLNLDRIIDIYDLCTLSKALTTE